MRSIFVHCFARTSTALASGSRVDGINVALLGMSIDFALIDSFLSLPNRLRLLVV